MGVTYVDVKISPTERGEHISEFTWVHEIDDRLLTRHYFVDYPGSKNLERQLTDIVGGNPLVRYSCRTVLQTFLDDIPSGNVVAARTEKQRSLLKSLIVAAELPLVYIRLFDDIIEIDGEKARVLDEITRAREEAPKRFGNAL